MSTYPDWVKKQRVKGTAVKKVGNSYYLYKHTSKRVPGKKYPQAVDKFIGVITPEGIVVKNKKKVSLKDIEVLEFGFSYSLLYLCPDSWKKSLKNDWENVLKDIIRMYSPRSYLLQESYETSDHRNIEYQEKKLFDSIDTTLEELLSLNTIYLLKLEDCDVISKINSEQNQLLEKLGIQIEGVSG